MLIIHRDPPEKKTGSIEHQISDSLRARFEPERIKYERQLENMESVLKDKLHIEIGTNYIKEIDRILNYREVEMNNLWVYIMSSGYAVIFVDNASSTSPKATNIYGTSLAYDETCEKLIYIRELCNDIGFSL